MTKWDVLLISAHLGADATMAMIMNLWGHGDHFDEITMHEQSMFRSSGVQDC